MKAALALATGHFSERPTTPSLRDSFACIWVHRMPKTEAPPIVVIPDGTIDLQWIDGTFRIAGPDRDPTTEIVPAGATVIGFRFRPAAAAAWLREPAAALLGQRVLLDELWGSKARRLAGSVRSGQGIEDLLCSLAEVIARCTPAHVSVDVPMRAAYDLIKQRPPSGVPLVPWLGRALAMSERTLRRRFDESFGYGPKTLDRILRHQRFVRVSRASKETSTAILAVEAGYSDQAHLVRESRRLTGTTPFEFVKIMNAVDYSDEKRRPPGR